MRSVRHPYGLPSLSGARRAADLRRVETGNAIAAATFADASACLRAGAGIAIENPRNSFMWRLREAQLLRAAPGVSFVHFTNCMFADCRRCKPTAVLTNMPELVARLGGRVCAGGAVCSRTGAPHLSWTPKVEEGRVLHFPTAGEAEYPGGLCEEIAKALIQRERAAQGTDEAKNLVFTEVFSGERAPLTRAVSEACWAAGLRAPSSSCSSSA